MSLSEITKLILSFYRFGLGGVLAKKFGYQFVEYHSLSRYHLFSWLLITFGHKYHTLVQIWKTPKIGRFPSERCRNDPHQRIRSHDGSVESWVIELCRKNAFGRFCKPTPTQHPRKILKTIFKQYWHLFENPYGAQNVWKNFFYNLRTSKLLIMSHTPTQNWKNCEKQVCAPFWKPILAKMNILIKNTPCVQIWCGYDVMKAKYAYAKSEKLNL